MPSFDVFQQALPYDQFLEAHGSPEHRQKWRAVFDQIALTKDQRDLLKTFTRRMNVLVLAGAWCGDCVNQCPAFRHFADEAGAIDLRFIDRDAHADVQKELQVNGGNRVPVVVFFSEDGYEAARFGDRPLSVYRQMMRDQAGDSCPTGLVKSGDPLVAQMAQDWLDQFERVQWMLRLSGRLRKLHAD